MELQIIQKKIHELRNQKVMLDFDLAELYEVETKNLNKSVKRNLSRFPVDFMFQLNEKEWEALRFQYGTSNKRGGTRYLPYAFTEQGVSMLSAILKSEKAVLMSISIIRAFVILRKHALDFDALKQQISAIEKEMKHKFKDVYDALNYLINKDHQQTQQTQRKKIGYK